VAHGTLIAESLRPGRPLAVALTVHEIRRQQLVGGPPSQPPIWTFVEVELADDDAGAAADAIAACLDPVGGWYCDLHTAADTIVVFPGRVVRYRAGDPDGRRDAEDHARSLGIPEEQIDWPEQ
jgi:hypothetical protein